MLSALAVAAATLGATAPTADAHAYDLVVAGKRSSVITIVLRTDLPLDSTLPMEVDGGRTYAAAVVERIDGPEPRAVLAAAKVKAFGKTVFSTSNTNVLKAGRYDVHLIADGVARVGFPLGGTDSMRVEPTKPQSSRIGVASAAVEPGTLAAELVFRGGVPAGRSALVALAVDGARVEQTYACVTVTSSCPPEPLRLGDPAPAVPLPATAPSVEDDAKLAYGPRSGDDRAAIAGVRGARAAKGTLRGALLLFG